MILELEASSAQIQRIVQSKAFRTSEVHRNLLTYLADKSLAGDADSLKEYTVGLDVFSKPESYDPRQESTVRMHVARLRQKLAEYYRTEGIDDPIVVDLPKGGFKLHFEPRAAEEAPVAASDRPAGRRWPWHETVLAALLIVAVAFALYYGERLRQVERSGAAETAAWTPELRQIWEPLVAPNRPLLIAVSTANRELSLAATGSGLYRLGEFFSLRKLNVQVLPSDQLGAPEVAMGNVLFLGQPADNRQMQAMSSDRPFVLETSGILNTDPQPGEPTFLMDQIPTDPQDTEESYALIMRVPGLYGNGEVLYVSGNRVASIAGGVQAFTDAAFARKLVGRMTSGGVFPRYFQVIVKVQSMDDMPIETTYVAHRELAPPESASSSK
jgi:hypothetical protein